MKTEYEHLRYIRENYGDSAEGYYSDHPIYYFRLPGGVDTFLRGYIHKKEWHEKHRYWLEKANVNAEVICIEGLANIPYGKSLEVWWKENMGHYDKLMHESVNEGFRRFFMEIDARDVSNLTMDCQELKLGPIYIKKFPLLPRRFFEEFFDYLKRESPSLANILRNPQGLKKALKAQSTTDLGTAIRRILLNINYRGINYREIIKKALKTRSRTELLDFIKELLFNYSGINHRGITYTFFPFYTKEGKISFEPTFLELGQQLFADALMAIKLHLIGRLMEIGIIPKGPIINYIGAGHIITINFFLRYPLYAMEVVLRMINELMTGTIQTLPEIYEIFKNPNWPRIIREICKLPLGKVTDDGKDLEVDIIDILDILKIEPEKIMPSDEEIKRLINSTKTIT